MKNIIKYLGMPPKIDLVHRVFIASAYIINENAAEVQKLFAKKYPDHPIPA